MVSFSLDEDVRVVVKNTFLSVEDASEHEASCARRARAVSLPAVFDDTELSDSDASTEATDAETMPDKSGFEGRVWCLAQDRVGCRQIQEALEISDDDVREALAFELQGHVAEAAHDPFANFVLQKCATLLPSNSVQFLIDELVQEDLGQVARHKFGCRVLQKLFENADPSQMQPVAESIIASLDHISRHAYGNYVVQSMIGQANDNQLACVVEAMEHSIRAICSHDFSVVVLGRCLSKIDDDAVSRLVSSVLGEDGLLTSMACLRLGHPVVSQMMERLERVRGPELDAVRRALLSDVDALRRSKHGRVVASRL